MILEKYVIQSAWNVEAILIHYNVINADKVNGLVEEVFP